MTPERIRAALGSLSDEQTAVVRHLFEQQTEARRKLEASVEGIHTAYAAKIAELRDAQAAEVSAPVVDAEAALIAQTAARAAAQAAVAPPAPAPPALSPDVEWFLIEMGNRIVALERATADDRVAVSRLREHMALSVSPTVTHAPLATATPLAAAVPSPNPVPLQFPAPVAPGFPFYNPQAPVPTVPAWQGWRR